MLGAGITIGRLCMCVCVQLTWSCFKQNILLCIYIYRERVCYLYLYQYLYLYLDQCVCMYISILFCPNMLVFHLFCIPYSIHCVWSAKDFMKQTIPTSFLTFRCDSPNKFWFLCWLPIVGTAYLSPFCRCILWQPPRTFSSWHNTCSVWSSRCLVPGWSSFLSSGNSALGMSINISPSSINISPSSIHYRPNFVPDWWPWF